MGWLKSILGIDGVVNTATKIVDKIAGTDFTPTDKAKFILDYQAATKHQSVARRVIAIAVTLVWTVILLATVFTYIIGHAVEAPQLVQLGADLRQLLNDVIMQPFSIIIGFYFATHMLSGIKK